ncbi:hypothetical protein P7H16_09935 [Paenibacillus larvae]|nr:hypothetical protein [Paenibacillus larvae]MDT2247192.1 hypothetical protein [Paenibacillus larvae]
MQTGIKLSKNCTLRKGAVTKLCKLAEVARSAYYKWLKWKPSIGELEILSLAKEVKLRYDKRKGVLGYRQIRHTLNPETQKELQQNVIIESCALLN